MTLWGVGDLAIAKQSAVCGCGGHSVLRGRLYRVEEIVFAPDWHPQADQPFLGLVGIEHYFHHSLFRKEQLADQDIFKLCSAPVPAELREVENV